MRQLRAYHFAWQMYRIKSTGASALAGDVKDCEACADDIATRTAIISTLSSQLFTDDLNNDRFRYAHDEISDVYYPIALMFGTGNSLAPNDVDQLPSSSVVSDGTLTFPVDHDHLYLPNILATIKIMLVECDAIMSILSNIKRRLAASCSDSFESWKSVAEEFEALTLDYERVHEIIDDMAREVAHK